AELLVGIDFLGGDAPDLQVSELSWRKTGKTGAPEIAYEPGSHLKNRHVGQLPRWNVRVSELSHPADVGRIDAAHPKIYEFPQRQLVVAQAGVFTDDVRGDVENRNLLDLTLCGLISERAEVANGLRREIVRGEHEELGVAEAAVSERLHVAHARRSRCESMVSRSRAIGEAPVECDGTRRASQLELRIRRRGCHVAAGESGEISQWLVEPHQIVHP